MVSRFIFLILIFLCSCESNHDPDSSSDLSSILDVDIIEAKSILNKGCVDCHGSNNSADLTLKTEEEFISKKLIVPGKPGDSLLLQRITHFSEEAKANMPPDGRIFTETDYKKLHNWILKMDDPGKVSSITSFQCKESAVKKPDYLKRLKKIEYINSLNSIIKRSSSYQHVDIRDVVSVKEYLDQIPEENKDSSPYRSFDKSISDAHVQGFYNVGRKVAELLYENTQYTRLRNILFRMGYTSQNGYGGTSTNYGCVGRDVSEAIVCYHHVIEAVGKLAYRRPLTQIEKDFYFNESSNAPDKAQRIKKILTLLLNSPNFLFRISDGTLVAPNKPGYERYSDYEIASNLSYTFWADSPSKELYNLAEQGLLSTEAGIAQAMDHIFSETNKDKVQIVLRQFYDEYLKIEKMPFIDQDKTNTFSTFAGDSSISTKGKKYRKDMIDELYDLLESHTWSEETDFSKVLISKRYFAKTPELAGIYGDSGKIWDGLTNLNFSASDRSGLLTRAGMLLTGGHQTSPIHTGVFVYRNIMCGEIPSPPPLDPADLIVEHSELFSTRQHVDAITVINKPNCVACHGRFNPYGYPFEKYDALGRLRLGGLEPIFNEAGDQVNTVGIDFTSRINLGRSRFNISSPENLSAIISDLPYPNNCYSKNLYEFVRGKSADYINDGCELKELSDNLKAKEGGMLESFKSIVNLDFMKYKKIPEEN